jgi:hypothetical protein
MDRRQQRRDRGRRRGCDRPSRGCCARARPGCAGQRGPPCAAPSGSTPSSEPATACRARGRTARTTGSAAACRAGRVRGRCASRASSSGTASLAALRHARQRSCGLDAQPEVGGREQAPQRGNGRSPRAAQGGQRLAGAVARRQRGAPSRVTRVGTGGACWRASAIAARSRTTGDQLPRRSSSCSVARAVVGASAGPCCPSRARRRAPLGGRPAVQLRHDAGTLAGQQQLLRGSANASR